MLSYKFIRAFTWLIALALAAWIIRDLPFEIIIETIFSLTVAQWFYWTLINLIIILILVWRWLVLTKGFKLKLNLINLLLLRQAGQSISFITPGPQFGGEPLQIFLLWKKYFISPGDSVLAVAADRAFELWTNFAVLLIGIIILFFTQTELANWVSIATLVSSLILILSLSIWFLINQSEKIETNINKLVQKWLVSKRLSEINFHSNNFTASLKTLLTNKVALIFALLLSISGWFLTFFELYLVLNFFSINLDLSQFVLLMVAMRLAFLLPLPGGIGTLEASVIWSFSALALPVSSAAALLALLRFRDILVLVAGFICLRLLQSKTVAV
ncbi:MAG: lysylphosphatidylglycerol synthase transmembrane domain-containing protein [Gammaproteobacteria bacterium]|jgi:glycosyltransferase 2 family protein|nr:lysylphosphatidylglycerol synthase transmembrane domain-containing protein [Gammaproteobacteria bacterium]